MFDELKGSRVLVRPYCLSDAEHRFEAIEESREHVGRWDPDEADACRSLEETRQWISVAIERRARREGFSNGIWIDAGTRFVGGVGLRPRGWSIPAFEIGYWVRVSAEGKGYITEAIGLVVDYALKALNAQRVEIRCDPENVRSVRVPERLGFQLEGRVRNVYRYPNGKLADELIFAITPA